MTISAQAIKEVREITGVGIMNAKAALEEVGGDTEKAVEALRKKGQAVVNKKQNRTAGEGWVGSYVHHNGKAGAMVELRCETDFVARNEEFKELAKQLAMQVVAAAPKYVGEADVPEDEITKEKEIIEEQLKNEGKDVAMIEKIMPGKVQKYYEHVCLMQQPFFLEDKKKVADLIADATVKLGEKIEITQFAHFAF